MSFFTNKHVIVAMIVAPLLAVASYLLVDNFVKERPASAVAGNSYPLVAKSNCRYSSGACDLVNASFKSQLTVSNDGSTPSLKLKSSHSLQNAKVGFANKNQSLDSVAPVEMSAEDDTGQNWSVEIPIATDDTTQLVVALSANDAHYFAETVMAFSEYETSFPKKFTSKAEPVTE